MEITKQSATNFSATHLGCMQGELLLSSSVFCSKTVVECE